MKYNLFAASFAALGLIMASTSMGDTFPEAYGTDDFNGYADGATVSELTGSTLGTWESGAADLSKISTGFSDKRLILDTEGDVVTNRFTQGPELTGAMMNGTNLLFSSKVQFVPSDELEETFTDEASYSIEGKPSLKFAIYALESLKVEQVPVPAKDPSELEDDPAGGEPAEENPEPAFTEVTSVVTNLVLYHGYAVNPGVYACTNEIVQCDIPLDFGDTERLHDVLIEMKYVDGLHYFKLKVDNRDQYAPMGLSMKDIVDNGGVPAATGGTPLNERVWFKTASGSVNDRISMVNFSGTGAVDSLALGYETPVEIADVTVTWASDPNIEVFYDYDNWEPIEGTSYTAKPGATIVFSVPFDGNEYAPYHLIFDSENAVYLDSNNLTPVEPAEGAFDDMRLVMYTLTEGETEFDIFASPDAEPSSPEFATDETITYGGSEVVLTEAEAAWLNGLMEASQMSKEEYAEALALGDGDSFSLDQEMLLGLDPLVESTVEFKVTSIDVAASDVKIDISLVRSESDAPVSTPITGTLKVYGTDDLAVDFVVEQSLSVKFDEGTTATTTFTTDKAFFKAVIE